MNINVYFKECNIIYYSMFVRYYAVHIIYQNDLSTNHIPTILKCTIAFKVEFSYYETFTNVEIFRDLLYTN